MSKRGEAFAAWSLARMDWVVSLLYITSQVFYKTAMFIPFREYMIAHILSLDMLRHDLLRSLFYMHMQPPLMNIIMGALAKLPGDMEMSHLSLHLALGLVAVHYIDHALRCLGVRRALRIALLLLLCWFPTFALFINWGYSSHIEFCLCCALVYGIARIERAEYFTRANALMTHVPLVLLGLTRPQWHIVILTAIAGMILYFKRECPGRRVYARMFAWCMAPLLLLYLKNLVLYGFFGVSSWLGCNLWIPAVLMDAPKEAMQEMERKGEISPYFKMGWGPQKLRLAEQYMIERHGYVRPDVPHHPSFDGDLHASLEMIAGCRLDYLDSMALITRYPSYYLNHIIRWTIHKTETFSANFFDTDVKNIDLGWLPAPLRRVLEAGSVLFYAVVPALVLLAACWPKGYLRRHLPFIATGVFLAFFMMVMSVALNGHEQERMRWNQQPFYIAFLALLLEMIARLDAACRKRLAPRAGEDC